MKLYTTIDQTAKLIEFGGEKPKSKVPFEVGNDELGYTYSIGELIEMLPKEIEHPVWFGKKIMEENGWWDLRIDSMDKEYPWAVVYHREDSAPLALKYATELIDALYDMIIMLKEEGII